MDRPARAALRSRFEQQLDTRAEAGLGPDTSFEVFWFWIRYLNSKQSDAPPMSRVEQLRVLGIDPPLKPEHITDVEQAPASPCFWELREIEHPDPETREMAEERRRAGACPCSCRSAARTAPT